MREFQPFQMRSEIRDIFPDPECISDERQDILWLDCVKFRRILDNETAEQREILCKLMIEELHELKRQSNLPHLSKNDLIQELKSPRFGLFPCYQEELCVLASNLQFRADIAHDFSQTNIPPLNRPVCEGGNYFTPVGHETVLPPHLVDSWRSKLEVKVQYGNHGSERERKFQEKMIYALEQLHKQCRLEHLNGCQWRNYWSSFSFEKCTSIRTRGMIKNLATEVVMLNSAIGGSTFSALADRIIATSFSDSNAKTAAQTISW
jgi:hypothetical protein